MKKQNLSALLIAVILLVSVGSLFAQTPADPQKTRQRTTGPTSNQEKKPQTPSTTPNGDKLEPDDTAKLPTDVPQDIQANRHQQLSEEADVVPYYNNFFNTYRLGPEDVISVSVFNQDRYSRAGIVIPPSGRIALQLVPGGVFVNGKTVEEVEAIITKKYDEYIIDPQVTVSLDKAASYRYSIIGDVAQPGIRLMNHRMTVTEAIAEAGGVTPTGDKSKIIVLRRTPNGVLAQIPVNLSLVYKGKAPDTTFLVPGDQILVPGNKWKTFQKVMQVASVASFARIFAGY
jgi:protein involved in polysaccharide export with SLBB domain